jgi:uncharacterized protein YbjT (DUF2867 family)
VKKILVIGASGFVGRFLVRGLLKDGFEVRGLARNPPNVQDLVKEGAEIVPGDILDPDSLNRALAGTHAAYICTHTLSAQPADKSRRGFVDLEKKGLENIVDACNAQGVGRVVYITFLGMDANSTAAWTKGRWAAEQFLIKSELNATVLRPGQIVGKGGLGFNMMMGQAKRRFTPVLGNGKKQMQNIAVEDLVYYLIGVLDEPRTYGKCYDVGCDDILTSDQMIDVAADVLGRRPPIKFHIPLAILSVFAPLIERIAKAPKGAVRGMADGLRADLIGNPDPIREILPRTPLSYRESIERALGLPDAS